MSDNPDYDEMNVGAKDDSSQGEEDNSEEIVNVSCRRGKKSRAGELSSAGPTSSNCDSNRAVIVSRGTQGQNTVSYRCVECDFTWSVQTGGTFPY